jgi:hypothetical protein
MRSKKLLSAVLLLIFLQGCALWSQETKKDEEYSKAVTILSDFSITILGYYGSQMALIPKDFNEIEFFRILTKEDPNQSKVAFIRDSFKVKVRQIDGHYSAMLCDPKTDRKLMEDFSCDMTKVEIQTWAVGQNSACVFEENWKQYCK